MRDTNIKLGSAPGSPHGSVGSRSPASQRSRSGSPQSAPGKIEKSDDSAILRDKNIKGLYIKKRREKTPKGQSKNTRVYDNKHACYFCSKVVLHINLHLRTHRNKDQVREILKGENQDFTSLRKLGDDKHNRECIDKEKGEIILARRPNDSFFDVTRFGPCPKCKEWVRLKGIKCHYKECAKHGLTDNLGQILEEI